MFQIYFRDQAALALSRIDEPYFSTIKSDILELRKNYFPKGKKCKKLHGKEKNLYRIRIGPYRALYHVDQKKKILTVLRVFYRNEGY